MWPCSVDQGSQLFVTLGASMIGKKKNSEHHLSKYMQKLQRRGENDTDTL